MIRHGTAATVATLLLAVACDVSPPDRAAGPAADEQTGFTTPFEASGGSETATYAEGIAFYERLAETYPEIELLTFGETDAGFPLHLAILSKNREFDPRAIHEQGRVIFFINNAIHAGEPDGVDASMMFLRDLVQSPEDRAEALDRVVLATVPFYSIGGVLNRSPFRRANQNGPEEHGFRGNARNYDLNRDFIKADTRNARAFTEIFHHLDPDVFVDTHVSNGADYQHVMTMDYPQKDKLGGVLAEYLDGEMMPFLYDWMAEEGFEMIPYVNVFGAPPDEGWPQFLDLPRYSSGYTALFHTIGFMSETHMLKPYDQRVRATYAFLDGVLELMARDGDRIREMRERTRDAVKTQESFALTWEVDRSEFEEVPFKGYEARTVMSEVTGLPRLLYDRERPWEGTVRFYDTYAAVATATRPAAYIIPQGWHEVLDRLHMNQVRLEPLPRDTTIEVEVYRIEGYTSRPTPYEGHFFHDEVRISSSREAVEFRAGDVVVPVDQWVNRYIVETLEPLGADSFFRWNFFDTVLQRKEGYAAYVFEDLAAELLEDDIALREEFEEMKREDPGFAASASAQLDFLFERSPHHEKEYLRYPVFRVPR